MKWPCEYGTQLDSMPAQNGTGRRAGAAVTGCECAGPGQVAVRQRPGTARRFTQQPGNDGDWLAGTRRFGRAMGTSTGGLRPRGNRTRAGNQRAGRQCGLTSGGKPCSRTCESGAKCRDGGRRGPTLKMIRRSSHSEGQIELVGGRGDNCRHLSAGEKVARKRRFIGHQAAGQFIQSPKKVEGIRITRKRSSSV